MKCVRKNQASGVSLVDVIEPVCRDNDVLIKMKSCGICGSDLGNIFGDSCRPSSKIGHEVAGIIVKKGNNVKEFDLNDRVFVHHHTPCNNCHYCKHGNQTMCEKYVECLEPCGMSEKFLVPEWNIRHGSLIKIPDTMSFEEASLIEPLACCIRAWKKLSFSKNDSVLVFGVGPIGVMHAMLAKHYGFGKIFCVDTNEFRLNFCKDANIGIPLKGDESNISEKISTHTSDLDLIIIATSQTKVFHSAINLVRKGGTILLFGEPSKKCNLKMDVSKIYSKEISVIPSYAASTNEIRESFEAINNKSLNIRQLITHKISIQDITKALNYARSGDGVMKVVITNEL